MSKLIYTDFERCTACRGCEVACQREHGGLSHVHVIGVEDRFAVPLACRHCDPAPCVAACPPQALSANGDGVTLDTAQCTGGTLCLFPRPPGVVDVRAAGKVAAHCDPFAPRGAAGRAPARVTARPGRALAPGASAGLRATARRRAAAEVVRAQPVGGGVL